MTIREQLQAVSIAHLVGKFNIDHDLLLDILNEVDSILPTPKGERGAALERPVYDTEYGSMSDRSGSPVPTLAADYIRKLESDIAYWREKSHDNFAGLQECHRQLSARPAADARVEELETLLRRTKAHVLDAAEKGFMSDELKLALVIANRVLDRINADPDDDLAVLARQLFRAHERELSASKDARGAALEETCPRCYGYGPQKDCELCHGSGYIAARPAADARVEFPFEEVTYEWVDSQAARGAALVTDDMVDRFLAWPLPKTVRSDRCVTLPDYLHPRSGTNLLTADEARQMLEYVLSARPAADARVEELETLLRRTKAHVLDAAEKVDYYGNDDLIAAIDAALRKGES